MACRDAALEWVRCFCVPDLDSLEALMGEGMTFHGPLFQAESRAAYMDALRAAPPEPATFEVLSVVGQGDEVAIFYHYVKDARTLAMAQWFRCENGKIAATRLVFDPAGVT